MRYLVAISVALLAFAGAAAWVVDAEPDWYLRTGYPLEYEHIVRAHASNYDFDPTLLAASSTPKAASTRMSSPRPGRSG